MNQRLCVVCRTQKNRQDLIRVVRYRDQMKVDWQQKADGRGAYVCRDGDCLQDRRLGPCLARALRGPVPAEMIETLRHLGDQGSEGVPFP